MGLVGGHAIRGHVLLAFSFVPLFLRVDDCASRVLLDGETLRLEIRWNAFLDVKRSLHVGVRGGWKAQASVIAQSIGSSHSDEAS